MIFYPTRSGRQVIAVQNNLLNLGNAEDDDPTDIDFIAKVNAHTITVHALDTGETLGTINFRSGITRALRTSKVYSAQVSCTITEFVLEAPGRK